VKLDSVPLGLTDTSATDSQSELKTNAAVTLNTAQAVTLEEKLLAPLPSVPTDQPQKPESIAVIFGTTFITIFLAEIGDKTQLSTLLMSAESHAPWVVFFGSGAALISTSLLGVLLGSWIASRLSPKVVEKSAGVMLLLISLMLFWDVAIGH
jgi:putative Ca2+/H+ antiporter (TMEM165/GDT1 family)